ncbi:type I restriction-modification system endonuclease [Haliovirga abyssi]|uniref:Type I restriction-modification system deoxyribonuclease n=1 Tax=Haliovirga abyssi TaxID=2996794 RepID=A0AAU9DKW1_9FUSO|nr:type I restriction-modification system endonuclease [Haliovirga abyssi]BDU51569.1 type I restriction-modification system deoxyribonuclease [Haliovirga abyssi]
MKSNFEFLIADWPTLANLGEFAEKNLFIDSNTTLIKLRVLAENIAKLIIKEENLIDPESNNQIDRLKLLKREDLLEREIEEIFHSLRIIGNKATHEGYSSFDDADTYLSMAVKLSAWFKEVYGSDLTFDSETTIYKTPEKFELTSDYEKLKKENEKLSKEFNELKAVNRSIRNKEEKKIISIKAVQKIKFDEKETRKIIDEQLKSVGWEADSGNLRFSKGTRPEKGRNIAIAEWPTSKMRVDYALFIGLEFVGVIEAKKKSTDVISVLNESKIYSEKARIIDNEKFVKGAPFNKYNIPFMFAANGREYNKTIEEKSGIWFLNGRKPTNHPKALKNWYSPRDIEELLSKNIDDGNKKLEEEPFNYLKSKEGLGLRYYQVEAIQEVEKAIVEGKDKILLTMATGTGKTRTAIALIYRLLKSGRFKRILFLVDRASLGNQAGDSFKEAKMEDLQTFAQIYDVKEIKDKELEDTTKVHIATIQGLVRRIIYSNDNELKPSVGQYDCIIIDEAHRGYILDKEMEEEEVNFKNQNDYVSKYRTAIEYFEAVKIGLTATPALHTVDIFGHSVYEYSYRQAVIDGNLVDHEPPVIIETELNTNGMVWQVGEEVSVYNRKEGKVEKERLDDELKIEIEGFNRRVITKNFNRTVIKELVKYLNPESEEKTLIFAATDEHADMIVKILKEEFEELGWEIYDNSIQKITGYLGKGQEEAIKRFKNEKLPNIVVTVDLLTTGINVPEICNLVFIRRVKSRILYEQMIGRATRLCDKIGKTHFKIFDTVGVYDSLKDYTDMKPIVQNPNQNFEKMIGEIELIEKKEHLNKKREEIIAKIQRKKKLIEKQELEEYFKLKSGNKTPEEYIEEIKKMPVEDATKKLMDDIELFRYLDTVKYLPQKQYISNHKDAIIEVKRGYGKKNKKPDDYLESFKKFIIENSDKIEALKLLKTAPTKITRQQLRGLKLILTEKDFSETYLNSAYKDLKNEEILADIISFIKNAIDNEPLINHEDRIKLAVNKIRQKKQWNALQKKWLDIIEKQLLVENIMQKEDFDKSAFKNQGGFKKIDKIFNGELESIIDELNKYLFNISA